MAYVTEKKMSKYPEKFGTGVIEGVASPETANNAYANAAMIPLFTLGIPGSPTIAILMGAFMMNGLIPGPFLFKEHGDFVWAVIASMYVGNLILLILNLPLIPMWVALLKVPYSILFAIILGFCVLGSYSLDNAVFDVGSMLAFGILGYIFKKLDIPLAPLVLTLILGPLMERGLRQSLEISRGDFTIFFTRPISLGLIVLAALFVFMTTFRAVSKVRGEDSQL
jgi:putative tricarboxylic transport membrane protein